MDRQSEGGDGWAKQEMYGVLDLPSRGGGGLREQEQILGEGGGGREEVGED